MANLQRKDRNSYSKICFQISDNKNQSDYLISSRRQVHNKWYIHYMEMANLKQESQNKYNVTMSHFCVPAVKVKGTVLHILSACCSLSYPARNAHVPYYVTCGLSDSSIFFHIS
jgi:hypothetical protein